MCISSYVQREREEGGGMGADMFTASRTCDRVSLTVPLWLFPLCFVLHLVCPRKAISSSQNKSIASLICLRPWRFVWAFRGCICTHKDGLRWVIFSPENMGQLISYYHISAKLDHIYPEKQQNNSKKDNGSKQMEGVMQVEGMLDKIGIVHWMSLSNTPILWITLLYLTNCTILSQEICFRGSQCYKCSLLVSGWRHNVSLTSQMDFKFARLFEILWIP